MMKASDAKKIGLFLGGVLFGTAGIKILSSKDAKKAYVQCTAAALRAKDSVMKTVTTVQENAGDVLAEAKQINEDRAAEEAEAENDLERLKAVVDGGKFDLVLEILNKPENQFVLTDYPSLKDWRDDVEARVKFYDAVSRISAQSLALMKLNFVKKDAVDE